MNKKDNFLRAVHHNSPEWIPYWQEGSFTYILPTFVEMPELGGYDDWGCLWEYSEVTGPYPSHEHRIKNVTSIPYYNIPDPYAPGLLDTAKEALKQINRVETVVACNNHIGMHERSYILMGMEEYLIEFALNESLVFQLIDRIFEFKYHFTKRMLDELDVEGIWLGDDWGMQTGLFFSPQKWREIIKPRLKKIYDLIHDRGKIIFQHSCGKIEAIIQDLVEIGLDVWNPCQPINDLKSLKEQYGDKLTFMGAVDSVIMATEGPAEVEKEVKLRIEQLGEGGGFILYPSHHVPFPEYNIRSFIDASIKNGKYT